MIALCSEAGEERPAGCCCAPRTSGEPADEDNTAKQPASQTSQRLVIRASHTCGPIIAMSLQSSTAAAQHHPPVALEDDPVSLPAPLGEQRVDLGGRRVGPRAALGH